MSRYILSAAHFAIFCTVNLLLISVTLGSNKSRGASYNVKDRQKTFGRRETAPIIFLGDLTMANANDFDMSVAAAKLVEKDMKTEISCPATTFPRDADVTMAYIPYQLDRTSYETGEALKNGTLFTVLNKPFLGGQKK